MSRKRKRIDEGVYEDQYGWAATVKVGKRQRELRFEKGISLQKIQAWRQSTREQLLDDVEDGEADVVTAGTFAEDLARREKIVSRTDRSHLRAWLSFFGPKPRRRIRSSHAKAALEQWVADKVSAKTIRHRFRVLREMWRVLDGPHAPTPVLGVKLPKPADPHPIAVPWKTVQHVAESLKTGKIGEKAHGPNRTVAAIEYPSPAKSRARFLVLATTGQRPIQLMRAQPADIDLKRRLWLVRPSKGGAPIALPLDRDMLKAWRAFIAAEAWGEYDTVSFAKLLRRHGWPEGIRPYELRHTLAIDMLQGGADIVDVQAALGHRRIDTTIRYYAHLQLARRRRSLRLKKRGKLR